MFQLVVISFDELGRFEAKRIYSPKDNVLQVFDKAVENKNQPCIQILQLCLLWILLELFDCVLVGYFGIYQRLPNVL